MSLVLAVVAVLAVTLLYTLFVRAKDIPQPEPVSPTQHLDERKAAIYENLRDLQFEYRVGKLSDEDYQQTKLSLQKELAVVIAEIARLTPAATGVAPGRVPSAAAVNRPAAVSVGAGFQAASPRPADPNAGFVCPHCGHEFPSPMKFCGECGK